MSEKTTRKHNAIWNPTLPDNSTDESVLAYALMAYRKRRYLLRFTTTLIFASPPPTTVKLNAVLARKMLVIAMPENIDTARLLGAFYIMRVPVVSVMKALRKNKVVTYKVSLDNDDIVVAYGENMITVDTDLTKFSWTDFCFIRFYIDCDIRLKNRRHILKNIELEYRRRVDNDLIPKDLPDEPPF